MGRSVLKCADVRDATQPCPGCLGKAPYTCRMLRAVTAHAPTFLHLSLLPRDEQPWRAQRLVVVPHHHTVLALTQLGRGHKVEACWRGAHVLQAHREGLGQSKRHQTQFNELGLKRAPGIKTCTQVMT